MNERVIIATFLFFYRSHSFAIRKAPSEMQGKKIYNLNVRGKRGNIVQVYPAVEYDFVPNRLLASKDDYLHIQWGFFQNILPFCDNVWFLFILKIIRN